ncbi:potassium channel family protein [Paraclostridium ghonii]|uniref:potassium channel family protein n=1 Tax=Paraclostridium ghonii TaxID=29358 RepID=UPI003525EA32
MIKKNEEDKKIECIDYTNLIFDDVIVINARKIYELSQNRNIDFSNEIFNKDVLFDNCEFKKDIFFENIIFKNNVSFNNCIFYGDCIFKNVEFSKELTSKKIFIHSRIKGQKISFENIKNMPRLDGIFFSNCCKVLLKDIKYEKYDYENAKINYRIAKNQSSITGDYEKLGHYYYMERYYGGKCIKRSNFRSNMQYINAKFIDFLARIIIGYGEKPLNIFIISFFIISVFAILYMITGIKYNNEIIKINNSSNFWEVIKNYINLWYFSMITFSTVGYGDMIVINITGKILVTIEVFLGVTMGASWASVIFRKMSR